jgi:hypothetical protein
MVMNNTAPLSLKINHYPPQYLILKLRNKYLQVSNVVENSPCSDVCAGDADEMVIDAME